MESQVLAHVRVLSRYRIVLAAALAVLFTHPAHATSNAQPAAVPDKSVELAERLNRVESQLGHLRDVGSEVTNERTTLLQSSLKEKDGLLSRSIAQTDTLLSRISTFATFLGVFTTVLGLFFIGITAYASISQARYLREQTTKLSEQRQSEEKRQENLTDASVGSTNALAQVLSTMQGLFSDRRTLESQHAPDQYQEQHLMAQGSIVGTQRVASVLEVVDKILNSRLLVVERGEAEIGALKKQLSELSVQVTTLTMGVESQQRDLEEQAAELAQIPRHGFKRRQSQERLGAFRQQFDSFVASHPDRSSLSGRSLYVRGVAAHFNNELQKTQTFLNRALDSSKLPEEDEEGARKRKSNVRYFLGLSLLNLGQAESAAHMLEETISESSPFDFLTRVVAAESRYMEGNFGRATELLSDVEKGVGTRAQQQNREPDPTDLGLLCRASLIRANMAIAEGKEDWATRARTHAESAVKFDPHSYYASCTLGQILDEIPECQRESTGVFGTAYQLVLDSGDLDFVHETRSRILLLIAAAMCYRRSGGKEESTFNGYLTEADQLREYLPRFNNQPCTVFSLLAKKNVASDQVAIEIERIKTSNWQLRK